MAPILQISGIGKSFPGVKALDNIDLDLEPGEVHALVGENGAGKSTLIKIIAGALEAEAGAMTVDGTNYQPRSPRDAIAAGVAVIHQERSFLPARSAAMNVMIGREPARFVGLLDKALLRTKAKESLAQLGADNIPLDKNAEDLTAGQRQILEITRALAVESKILVMDEPTSALSALERETLFAVVEKLKTRGMAILYVSHRLDEIFRLAGRVTVLRDGRRVSTSSITDQSRDSLISDMIGRPLDNAFPPRREDLGEDIFSARDFFSKIDFTLREGEVLGITGLAGSGKEELARALFGALPRARGEVILDGLPVTRAPAASIAAGIAFIPEDRKQEGLILGLSVGRNISLPSLRKLSTRFLRIRKREEEKWAREGIERLAIKTPGPGEPCLNLSGGNQQKTALARWLMARARVLILSHPTQEIDVGARFDLYKIIADLSAKGSAVVLVSSEPSELRGLCHRVMVMRDGAVAAELMPAEADEETILRHALGEKKSAQAI